MTDLRRAANHEGSVYQSPRGSGRWFAKASYRRRDGRLARRRRGPFDSEAKAKKALSALLKMVEAGEAEVVTIRVRDFLQEWLDDIVEPNLRPRTVTAYTSQVTRYIEPALGHHRLDAVEPHHVQAMLTALRRRGLSVATVAQTHRVAHRAFEQAREWRLIRDNPVSLVRLPQGDRRERSVLAPAQVRALLAKAGEADDRLEPLYAVAVSTGLRLGELLGLAWADVDVDAGVLRVRHQLQQVDRKWRLDPPKSARGRRTIALPATAVAALRRRRAQQSADRLKAGPDFWHPVAGLEDLVFTTGVGTPLSARNVSRSFKAALTRAGLPDVRFHDLRHAAASYLAAGGVTQRAVMDILGHSSSSLTTEVYTHLLDDQRRDAAARMDTLLGGAG